MHQSKTKTFYLAVSAYAKDMSWFSCVQWTVKV